MGRLAIFVLIDCIAVVCSVGLFSCELDLDCGGSNVAYVHVRSDCY